MSYDREYIWFFTIHFYNNKQSTLGSIGTDADTQTQASKFDIDIETHDRI